MDLETGTDFAGYTVLRELGTGGMGAVYLVQHPRLPRQDAMKVIHSHLSADPIFAARFQREAELACTLDHPSLVKVYDRGLEDGRLWLTMQYIRGQDADQLLRRDGAMEAHRAVRVVGEIGDALDFAHSAGLVHRDVKPANILLSMSSTGAERAYLTDFGIAHASNTTRQLTDTGDLLATLPYAAPEQLLDRPVTGAVDVYALGCVLYELVTGRRLFDQESPPALMGAVLSGPTPQAWAALPAQWPGLQQVIRTAVAQDPADRFPTCSALAAAAREAVPTAKPTVVVPRPPVEQRMPGPVPVPGPGPLPDPPPRSPWPSGPTWPSPLTGPARTEDLGRQGPPAPPWPPGDWLGPVERQPASRPKPNRRWLWVVGALVLAAAVAAGVVVFLGMGPDAPGRVRVEAQADGVQVRWNEVEGAAEYEVLRDGEAVGRSDSTTYLDGEVGSGAVVSYTVVALTSDSERSDPSEAVRVTAALRPVTDLAAAVDGASVRLTWGPVDNAESYQVLRDDAVIRNDLQSPPFVEEGLGAGSYTYTVVAIDENGDAASSSATVSAEISPWLGAAPLAATFPDLVPSSPGGTGWDGGTCDIGELLERATASHAITCTYPNGIYAELLLYADQDALDERLAFLDTLADPAAPRTYADGGWYRQSPAGVTNPAWEAWGFVDEDRVLMEIYVQWDGRTVADLDTAFFYRAPWN